MADPATCPPLVPATITTAHAKIAQYIHRTPLLTCKTLDRIASAPYPAKAASSPPRPTSAKGHLPNEGQHTARPPAFRLFFKCENFQRIGAFKPRGAFYALVRLIDELGIEEVRTRGVIAHSSGNFAQALSLAASEFSIPAHIVMPTISTPSKIAGTQAYTRHVYFCGSTAAEREARVKELQKETGAILVPPYDHPDIMLGQGTAALEMDEQYQALRRNERKSDAAGETRGTEEEEGRWELDAVVSPLGGGGLTGGTAVWFSDKPTLVFGAEPSYQGGNDAEQGLNAKPPKRVETVKTLTIADGLRTPLGHHPWNLFTSTTRSGANPLTSDQDAEPEGKKYLEQVYSATEFQIKAAMRLIMERMKLFIEPSAAVPLAVILYNEQFRTWVSQEQAKRGDKSWDVGVILSGGNTTIEAILGIFGKEDEEERAEGKLGLDGRSVAENVAG